MSDRRVIVTTSWDDGHELDTKLAELLADRGCTGTFYVSPRSREIEPPQRISRSSLRDLSTAFEVGSHTLTHPRLTRLPPSEAAHEITEGRLVVEEMIGRRATSFCYPYGAFRPEHTDLLEQDGIRVGRTTRRFDLGDSTDPLTMATTTHAARYRRDLWSSVSRSGGSPFRGIRLWRDWEVLARQVVSDACDRGGVIHLWGHSWEIEQNDDWRRLSELLGELAGLDNVTMLTNGEVGELIRYRGAEAG